MNNIVNIARHVYKTLGPGYNERIYHNCLEVGFRKANINYDTERVVNIEYEGHVVGNTRADLIVDNAIVVELKAIKTIGKKEINQLDRYVKALSFTSGLLINFPPDGDDIGVHLMLEGSPEEGNAIVEDL